MKIVLQILALFWSLPIYCYASICTGPTASPNWYGTMGYPPYFTRSSSESCPQKYSLTRCEQSAVMTDGTADFTVDALGNEICTPNGDCFATKQNCNDTLVCSDLLKLKDELMEGGHTIVCRHEKTSWQQNTGEVKGCQVTANCLDEEVKVTQRQLQPLGWQSAYNFATSFREMGIPIGKTYSSPFTRCADHAEVFSDDPNEPLLGLTYMAVWQEILKLNNITAMVQANALKWQAYNIRNLVGKKPLEGTNTVIVTHGLNIKLGFGTAVDEGYCMVFKPEDTLPSLAESIGSFTVGNKVFTFDNDAYPVDAIARMSPESALLMQTCDDVRSEAMTSTDIFSKIDSDHDMKITKEEYTSVYSHLNNKEDAFEFISSVVGQPDFLGKEKEEDSFELGQFFHINWGWREYAATGGDTSYPWRSILENTIGPMGNKSSESRVAAFKRVNLILSQLIEALRNQKKYPTIEKMEERLINCNADDNVITHVAECATKTFMGESGGNSYIPIGPGDGGAASLNGESIFNTPLAYPSDWKPQPGFYDSRLLKVATCLISEKFISLSDALESMGCEEPPKSTPPPGSTCAKDYETSRSCGFRWGKNECCSGLVCHSYQSNLCVKEQNMSCAGPNMKAKSCGSKFGNVSLKCCSSLVCDYEEKKCVSPDERHRDNLLSSSSFSSTRMPSEDEDHDSEEEY